MTVKSVAEPNKVLLESTLTRHMIPIIRQVQQLVNVVVCEWCLIIPSPSGVDPNKISLLCFLNTCGPEGFMNQPMGDTGQPPAAPLAR
jgi:hypothetical protein